MGEIKRSVLLTIIKSITLNWLRDTRPKPTEGKPKTKIKQMRMRSV